MKMLDEAAQEAYLALLEKEDGEVVGLLENTQYPHQEPYTVHWNGDDKSFYISGDTISEWGVHNLLDSEAERCGFSAMEVEIAREYFAKEGEGISLDRLAAEVSARSSVLPEASNTHASKAFLPEGWTEATPGGMATNAHPTDGGIVDRTLLTEEWFVIFHRDGLKTVEGLASRDEAFRVFEERMKQADDVDLDPPAPGI